MGNLSVQKCTFLNPKESWTSLFLRSWTVKVFALLLCEAFNASKDSEDQPSPTLARQICLEFCWKWSLGLGGLG